MRKKLFAVIMSAMMMITFMPTMAFAGVASVTQVSIVNAKLSDDCKTVTGDVYESTAATPAATDEKVGTLTLSVTKSFSSSDGMVHVYASGDALPTASYHINYINGSSPSGVEIDKYYDLTGATIVNDAGTKPSIEADNYLDSIIQVVKWTDAFFKSESVQDDVIGKYVKLVEPAALVASGKTAQTAKVLRSDVKSVFTVTARPAKYVRYEADGDRDIALEFERVPYTTTKVVNIDSAAKSVAITILSNVWSMLDVKLEGSANAEHIALYNNLTKAKDNIDKISATYVGEDQKFTVKTEGVKVEYSTDEGKTFTDKAPEMVKVGSGSTVKNGNKPYDFMIKVTKGSATPKYARINVTIKSAPMVLEFKSEKIHLLPGTKAKVEDLVKVSTLKNGKKVDIFSGDKKLADKILDIFVNLDNIPKTTANIDLADLVNIYSGVDLEDELEKAVIEDESLYDLVYRNYELGEIIDEIDAVISARVDATAATMLRTEGIVYKTQISYDGVNDVTAPNKVVTYKAKNGKLAKTKTYKLKATADYGKVSFTKMNTVGGKKIVVKKGGKVTIKKGLKKGTYKVKVKVKAPGAKANMTLKVKIK